MGKCRIIGESLTIPIFIKGGKDDANNYTDITLPDAQVISLELELNGICEEK